MVRSGVDTEIMRTEGRRRSSFLIERGQLFVPDGSNPKQMPLNIMKRSSKGRIKLCRSEGRQESSKLLTLLS